MQVGHIEHFNPVMEFMESRVSNPRFITADRLAPFNPRGTEVGVVLDLMIHDIGVVLKLANSRVEKIRMLVGVNRSQQKRGLSPMALHSNLKIKCVSQSQVAA